MTLHLKNSPSSLFLIVVALILFTASVAYAGGEGSAGDAAGAGYGDEYSYSGGWDYNPGDDSGKTNAAAGTNVVLPGTAGTIQVTTQCVGSDRVDASIELNGVSVENPRLSIYDSNNNLAFLDTLRRYSGAVVVSLKPNTGYTGTFEWYTQYTESPCNRRYDWQCEKTRLNSKSLGFTTPDCAPPTEPPTVNLQVKNTTIAPDNWIDGDITINYGEETALFWESTNTNTCTVTQGQQDGFDTGGATRGIDSTIDEPGAGSTRYTVSCTGPGGTKTDTLVITTRPYPTVYLEVANTTIGSGYTRNNITIEPTEQIALHWKGGGSANRCSANFTNSNAVEETISGVTEPDPGTSKDYIVACYDGYSPSASDTLKVTVNSGSGADINVDDTLVHVGDTVNVSWDVGTSDPATCEIRRGNNVISGYETLTSAIGSFSLVISAESTFTLYCEAGANADSATVTVLPEFQET